MSLRTLLEADGLVLGTWTQIASDDLIDMLGLAGYAFTIVDCEHTAIGLAEAERLFRACAAAGVMPLVRVPANDRTWIGRSLDAGAAAVVVPGIESAHAVREAVAATRGACPGVRAAGHVVRDWRAWRAAEDATPRIVALVETLAGASQIEAICAEPGLAALLVGPFDLSVSMGLDGDHRDPRVRAALERMLAAAQAHGLPTVVPVFDADPRAARAQLEDWRARGVRGFAVGTDKILVAAQLALYRAAMLDAPA